MKDENELPSVIPFQWCDIKKYEWCLTHIFGKICFNRTKTLPVLELGKLKEMASYFNFSTL